MKYFMLYSYNIELEQNRRPNYIIEKSDIIVIYCSTYYCDTKIGKILTMIIIYILCYEVHY